jgi:Fur family ferric uptake transcriptional regulator
LAIISKKAHTVWVVDAGIARDRQIRTGVARRPDVLTRLRTAGLSPTMPRRRVLEALDGQAMPVSAGDLYTILRASGAEIGLTSVYRILHVFVDKGLAHAFAGTEQRYRTCVSVPHAHLVCRSCGLVIEEPADNARRWLPDVDFEIDVDNVSVYGVCGPCRRGADGMPVP